MYSVIIFLCGFAEVVLVVFSYVMKSQIVFSNVVLYGSPLYMAMNFFKIDSALLAKNPLYLSFAAFHVLKYLCYVRSKFVEDTNVLRTIGIIMEAAYLGICAYYLV